MNYLKISNKGLMDINSLKLLGASSKRGDTSKIGMFGSGNKYALAYLLRNNYEVLIYSGKDEIKLTTKLTKLRDKEFNVICINGEETSITTEFGKDWEFWQAIREIYCNAVDEGGYNMEYVSTIIPFETETHFYIRTRPEVTEFVSHFDDYFAQNKKVLFECKQGKILAKSGNSKLTLYRKGIKCFETKYESIFDYDLSEIDIDENRLVKYSWYVAPEIWNLVYRCNNEELIRTILFGCGDDKYIEHNSGEYSSPNTSLMSKEYINVLNTIEIAPSNMSGLLNTEERQSVTIIPSKIFEQAKSHITNENLPTKFKVYKGHIYREIKIDNLHQSTLNKAYDFFKECNYTKPLQYDVKVGIFEDKKVLGFADMNNNEIVLSDNCLDKGVQCVIEVMIEEFIHLKYEVKDETRGFQNSIITEFVNLLKIKNAYLV